MFNYSKSSTLLLWIWCLNICLSFVILFYIDCGRRNVTPPLIRLTYINILRHIVRIPSFFTCISNIMGYKVIKTIQISNLFRRSYSP